MSHLNVKELPARFKGLLPVPRREIKGIIEFTKMGEFQSYYSATDAAKALGYGVGAMCSPMPTALIKGFESCAKWRNLTAAEKGVLDGMIVSDSFRDGPCFMIEFGEIVK